MIIYNQIIIFQLKLYRNIQNLYMQWLLILIDILYNFANPNEINNSRIALDNIDKELSINQLI